ncbi:MAG: ABC transporter permease subunit [Actinomycetota bacterium]|nr:ABC transporter permease subunit [Actinomycetota bacterium]
MFWKELRESRWRFIIGLIVFVLFAASLPLLYEWLFKEFLKETLKTVPFPLPKEALAQIELMEKQYDFYIWSQWFGKNLYQFGTILAILMGMGLFASEASKQTMEFLLSKPISRNRVALVKFLVGALEIAIIVAVSSFSIYPAAKFTGHDVELSKLIIGSVPTCVGLLLIF